MTNRPLFVVTHPRACSTAFERVFMTRVDDLACVHEPFGDAFYYGPERLSARYEDDESTRKESGFEHSTFEAIFKRIEQEGEEGKRLFIKDMIYYLVPPNGKAAQIAPSLDPKRRGVGTRSGEYSNGVGHSSISPPFPFGTEAEQGNPTVVPEALLKQFHFTFLIRNPHNSIPSFYRCTIPPRDKTTNFYGFDPAEAGYEEVRRFFDYLVAGGQVGPKVAGQVSRQTNGVVNGEHSDGVEICLIDADDLLDNPEGVIRAFCKSVGLDFQPSMLVWDSDADHHRAKTAFEKWRGWHDDAIDSKDLKARTHKKKEKTEDEWDAEWKEKYGEEGSKVIRDIVDKNMADYLYLKRFAVKV